MIKDIRRIVWIASKLPYPAMDGAQVATQSILTGLAELGHEIHLYAFADKASFKQFNCPDFLEKVKQALGIRSISLIPKKYSASKVSKLFSALTSVLNLSDLGFTYLPFRSTLPQGLRDQINNSDIIVFDGPHTAATFLNKGKLNLPKNIISIYRAHNVEQNLWKQYRDKARFIKFFLLHNQFKKVREFENNLVSQATIVAGISEDDCQFFRRETNKQRIIHLPAGLDFKSMPSQNPKEENYPLQLLFLGNMAWAPNREGLLWFLKEVWNGELDQSGKFILKIAGKHSHLAKSEISNYQNVNFVGEVNNLEELYENIDVSIVPILSGSGVRIKIIEASSYSKPVISTSIGSSGLGLEAGISILTANSKEEWINAINNFSPEKLQKIGKNANLKLRNDYDRISAAGKFIEQIFPPQS